VKYDGSNAYIPVGAMAVEFVLWDELWRCDLQTKWNWNLDPPTDYQCASKGPLPVGGLPDPADPAAPRVSPDGRWESFLQGGQVVIRPAGGGAVVVLGTDGTADFPYQPGSIYWSDDSKTITAYRVRPELWQRHTVSSNVKSLIARGEWTVPR
jgi:hypothetical protein